MSELFDDLGYFPSRSPLDLFLDLVEAGLAVIGKTLYVAMFVALFIVFLPILLPFFLLGLAATKYR